MAITNYSALSNDARTYIAKNLILLAKYYLRFYDIGDKQKLPANSSKTMRFVFKSIAGNFGLSIGHGSFVQEKLDIFVSAVINRHGF